MKFEAGDVVYLFIRNPHTQDVANVQEAAVVKNPENPAELAVFVYETYYPLTDDLAIYTSLEEAESAYRDFFEEESTA
ncbi:transcriptional regulator [Lysinibacillus yapensis]|uniref:Transcriptional regulator n=2 Tax=Ureibacillus yapensis TaxID=2304605 RepID=A0A396SLB7_9BACL|nr:transcriptional regulator [Lysinibacillus yapensis]